MTQEHRAELTLPENLINLNALRKLFAGALEKALGYLELKGVVEVKFLKNPSLVVNK